LHCVAWRNASPVIAATGTLWLFAQSGLAHIITVDLAGAGLHIEREGVAQPQYPDGPVFAGGHVVERIVRRNRTVWIDPLIDIHEMIGRGLTFIQQIERRIDGSLRAK
jgi:hypothetical protein